MYRFLRISPCLSKQAFIWLYTCWQVSACFIDWYLSIRSGSVPPIDVLKYIKKHLKEPKHLPSMSPPQPPAPPKDVHKKPQTTPQELPKASPTYQHIQVCFTRELQVHVLDPQSFSAGSIYTVAGVIQSCSQQEPTPSPEPRTMAKPVFASNNVTSAFVLHFIDPRTFFT